MKFPLREEENESIFLNDFLEVIKSGKNLVVHTSAERTMLDTFRKRV